MPRDPAGTYSYPPGIEGIPDQTIESADYNSFLLDVQQDLNTPRPIVAGGTGSANPHDAMVALSGEITNQEVDNYDSFPFMAGSFSSAAGTTSEPVTGHDFAGICYVKDDDLVLEARDLDDTATPGTKYVRQKIGGTWGAWGPNIPPPIPVVYASDTPPVGVPDNSIWIETDTGLMFVLINDGDSTQWVQHGGYANGV